MRKRKHVNKDYHPATLQLIVDACEDIFFDLVEKDPPKPHVQGWFCTMCLNLTNDEVVDLKYGTVPRVLLKPFESLARRKGQHDLIKDEPTWGNKHSAVGPRGLKLDGKWNDATQQMQYVFSIRTNPNQFASAPEGAD